MDHQSFSYAGVGSTPDEVTLARMEAAVATADVVGALTKNNAGDGGYHDNETALVIAANERERERERSVVNAVTSTIQYGADDSTAQAGHLIVEEKS